MRSAVQLTRETHDLVEGASCSPMKSRRYPRADDLLDLLTERARLIVFVDQRISAGQSGARRSKVDFGDMNDVERRSGPSRERRTIPKCL